MRIYVNIFMIYSVFTIMIMTKNKMRANYTTYTCNYLVIGKELNNKIKQNNKCIICMV